MKFLSKSNFLWVSAILILLGVFNVVHNNYFELLKVGGTLKTSILLIKANFLGIHVLENKIRPTTVNKLSNEFESPNKKYTFDFDPKSFKTSVLLISDRSEIFAIPYPIMTPNDVYWIIDQKGLTSHIVYEGSEEDTSGIFITNLLSKKTIRLNKYISQYLNSL